MSAVARCLRAQQEQRLRRLNIAPSLQIEDPQHAGAEALRCAADASRDQTASQPQGLRNVASSQPSTNASHPTSTSTFSLASPPVSRTQLQILEGLRRRQPTALLLVTSARRLGCTSKLANSGARHKPRPWELFGGSTPQRPDADDGLGTVSGVGASGPRAPGAPPSRERENQSSCASQAADNPAGSAEASSPAAATVLGPGQETEVRAPGAADPTRRRGDSLSNSAREELDRVAAALQVVDEGLRLVASGDTEAAETGKAWGREADDRLVAFLAQYRIDDLVRTHVRDATTDSLMPEKFPIWQGLAQEIDMEVAEEAYEHASQAAAAFKRPWLARAWWRLWQGEVSAVAFLQTVEEGLWWEGPPAVGVPPSIYEGALLPRVSEGYRREWRCLLENSQVIARAEWDLAANRAVCGLLLLVVLADHQDQQLEVDPLVCAAMSTCYVLLQDLRPQPASPRHLYDALRLRFPLELPPDAWQPTPRVMHGTLASAGPVDTTAHPASPVGPHCHHLYHHDHNHQVQPYGRIMTAIVLRHVLQRFTTDPARSEAWVQFLVSLSAIRAYAREPQRLQRQPLTPRQIYTPMLNTLVATLLVPREPPASQLPPQGATDTTLRMQPPLQLVMNPRLCHLYACGIVGSAPKLLPGPTDQVAGTSGSEQHSRARLRARSVWQQLVHIASLPTAGTGAGKAPDLVRLGLESPEEIALTMLCMAGCKQISTNGAAFQPTIYRLPGAAGEAAAKETTPAAAAKAAVSAAVAVAAGPGPGLLAPDAEAGQQDEGLGWSVLVWRPAVWVRVNDPDYDWKEIQKHISVVTATSSSFAAQYKVLRDLILQNSLLFSWQQGAGVEGVRRLMIGLSELRAEMLGAGRDIAISCVAALPADKDKAAAGSAGGAKKGALQAGAAKGGPATAAVAVSPDTSESGHINDWFDKLNGLLGQVLARQPLEGGLAGSEPPPAWLAQDLMAVDAVEGYLAMLRGEGGRCPEFRLEVAVAECALEKPKPILRPTAATLESGKAEKIRQEREAAVKRKKLQELNQHMFN